MAIVTRQHWFDVLQISNVGLETRCPQEQKIQPWWIKLHMYERSDYQLRWFWSGKNRSINVMICDVWCRHCGFAYGDLHHLHCWAALSCGFALVDRFVTLCRHLQTTWDWRNILLSSHSPLDLLDSTGHMGIRQTFGIHGMMNSCIFWGQAQSKPVSL